MKKLRLDDELYKRLKHASEVSGRGISEIVRIAYRRWVAECLHRNVVPSKNKKVLRQVITIKNFDPGVCDDYVRQAITEYLDAKGKNLSTYTAPKLSESGRAAERHIKECNKYIQGVLG